MDLQLDHVRSLTDLLTPVNVVIILALLVFALLTLIFTHRWWGLVAGALILAGALTVAAWLGLQIRDSLSTDAATNTLRHNTQAVKTWASDKYQLTFTDAQAKTLATGTENFAPGPNVGDAQFGTIDDIPIQVTGGRLSVPVTLFYDDHTWQLAYQNSGSGEYLKVPVP